VNRRRLSLAVLAVAAAAILIRLAMPLGFGLFLGALLAFVLQPVYERLLARRVRRVPAALLCSVGTSLVLAGILFGLGYLVLSELVRLAQTLPQDLAPGGSLHDSVVRLTSVLRERHINLDDEVRKLKERLAPVVEGLAGEVAAASGSLIVSFIMMSMANFNILLRWDKMVAWAERDLPFHPGHTRKLLREFQLVGRQVLVGTFAASLIQGTLGGLVCLVTGVPNAAFFGAVTAFLSPIPVLGSLVVWLGVGVYRIATGHVVAGVAELILGALFVGVLVDDFVRPKLVGGGPKFPAILTFIGLLGGVAVFGLGGLIVGPIVVALCVAVLKIYGQGSEPVAERSAATVANEKR